MACAKAAAAAAKAAAAAAAVATPRWVGHETNRTWHMLFAPRKNPERRLAHKNHESLMETMSCCTRPAAHDLVCEDPAPFTNAAAAVP